METTAINGWHSYNVGMFIRRKWGDQSHYYIKSWASQDHIHLIQVDGPSLGYELEIDVDMLHENFVPAVQGYESDYFKLYETFKMV